MPRLWVVPMASTKESKALSTAPPQLTHRQILEVLVGLMLGMFLAALDQTIVTSAIRTIGDDLHGLSVQAWVTTAYLITATISTPLYGKLSDIYGRKRFFLAAITIFVIGSAACSFATSMSMLAGFRAFQGLGAGGLFSLALAIIGDIVQPRERARYQGYFLAVFGASSVLGPVIGGFFAGADDILGLTGWRWVFLVNVPIGIVALIVVWFRLKLHHTRRDHRIDWWGAISICVCLAPLLTVAEQGRTWGWGSPRSIWCYVVGGIGLVAFVVSEALMKENALIPLRFFRNPTFSLTSIAGFIVGMGMFGGLAMLPLYLQIVHGATPTRSGLQLLPMTGGIMLGSIISGQVISRTGRYKIFPVLGAVFMVGGLLLLHAVGVGDRGRHLVGDFLPADGRDRRHRHLSVDSVLHRRRPHHRRIQGGRPRFAHVAGGRRKSGRPVADRGIAGRFGSHILGARRHVVPRPGVAGTGPSVQGRIQHRHGPHLPAGGRHHGAGVPAVPVPPPGAVARNLRGRRP
jgi:EmrB/QacA subfamily drug resistance transporter